MPMELSHQLESFITRCRIIPDRIKSLNDQKEYNLLITLKLVTHNIHGLASKKHKMEGLLKFAKEKQIDIISLCDTNIDQKQGGFQIPPHYQDRYISYLSTKDNKLSGSGVALIVNINWADHH
jgi:HKD family nuclease